ncbi:MAG: CDP-alcohol phosphatidyltransferase family protein [Pirellulaceae bacterium]
MRTNKKPTHSARSNRDSNAMADRFWTIPNGLCLVRLLGSPVLLALAWWDQPSAFVVLLVTLIATDWIDGRLARWLNQHSTYGARLDTAADVTLFACLLIGGVMLKHEFLMANWPWAAAPALSYLISSLTSLVRFRRPPSYHTRIAKLSSYLVIFGSVLVIVDVDPWLFRAAMATVTLGNLEAVGITLVLPHPRADVPSLRAALRIRRAEQADAAADSGSV